MHNVTLSVERNESHPEGAGRRELGTFEWVQLTYHILRTAPEGDTDLATWNGDYWELQDGSTWSDIIIGAEAKA